jgi:hypothetical protein
VANEEYRNQLIARMDRCQEVITNIGSNPAWKVLLEDLGEQRTRLDDSWQEIIDEKKMETARVIKMAIMHVANLPLQYANELEQLKRELQTLDNPDKEIQRDYDAETITRP